MLDASLLETNAPNKGKDLSKWIWRAFLQLIENMVMKHQKEDNGIQRYFVLCIR